MSFTVDHLYRFGDFTLDVDQRVLLRKGKPQPLAPKVFDTLLILVEKKGRLVAKDELMNRLWPDTFVEEANLTFNIQQLRKALGDRARKPIYIETVTRRGYRFISVVEELRVDGAHTSATQGFGIADPHSNGVANVPVSKSGREDIGTGVELAKAAEPLANEEGATTTRVDKALTGSTKKTALVTATVLIVLAGIGLVAWRLSNESAGANPRPEIRASVITPPRIEKLTGTGQSRQAAISPDGKYIAYTRYYDNKSSVWLRELATNNNVEIVPPGGLIYGLAFANTGENLYFARRGEAISEPLLYRTALYRVSLVGGVPTKIVDTLEGNFSIASDDKRIAFIRQNVNRDGQRERALTVVNSDGSGERTLLVNAHPEDLDMPLWSPSDDSIICACGSSDGGGQNVRLIQVNLSDGTNKELSHDRFFHISRMAWLPDKSALIMTATKNLGYNNQLWRVSYPGIEISQISDDASDYLDLSIASRVDGAVATLARRISDIWLGFSGEPQKLKKITEGINDFCWIPDGRLVYSSTATGNIDLWIMNPNGSEQHQLTVSSGVNLRPSVATDGRYIVFLSNRTGSLQVWRMNLDGTNQTQLTEGPAKDCSVVSPDGKWVLYNTTDDWHLWKVSIDGGEPVQLTRYVAGRPSVSPDGKMIACIGRNESARKLLILSFETGQLLKEFEFVGWSSRLQWAPEGKSLIYATERGGVGSLIDQPLSGDPPKQIVDLGEDELFDFGYSFDGRYFAVIRGSWQHDIVLIGGLNSSWNTGSSSEASPIARQQQ